jgi:hypothetical protein
LVAGDIDGDGENEVVDCGWGINMDALNSLLSEINPIFVSFLSYLPDSTDWFWPQLPLLPADLVAGEATVVWSDQNIETIAYPSLITGVAVMDTGVAVATAHVEIGFLNDLIKDLNDSLRITGPAWEAWADVGLPAYAVAYDAALTLHNAWALNYYAWYSGGMVGPPPTYPIINWPAWPAGEPDYEDPEFTARVTNATLYILNHGLQEIYSASLKDNLATLLTSPMATTLDGDGTDDLVGLRLVMFRDIDDEPMTAGAVQVFTTSALATELAMLSASAEGAGIRVVWEVVNPEKYRDFKILRGTKPGGPFVLLDGKPVRSGHVFAFLDSEITIGTGYYYKVEARTVGGTVVSFGPTEMIVGGKSAYDFRLSQNFPNPFSPVTSITFVVGTRSKANVRIFDVAGREVRTLFEDPAAEPGVYQIVWDGTNNEGQKVASGIYFCRMEANGDIRKVRKMLLLK